MLAKHIALVPATDGGDVSELARVGAALQKQVLRDVAPCWGLQASVSAFPRLEDVPVGYWPIVLTPRQQGWNAGVHLDENGQPFAQVELSAHWTLDASRACLELLVNPLGDRTVTAPSPRADQGLAQVLVELAGACADLEHAYAIDGVLVSDFCTPAYFVRDEALGHRPCSFHGSLSRPLQLLPGGRMTWFDVATSSWWMRVQRRDQHEDRRLGALERPFSTVRELLGRQRFSVPDPAHREAFAGVAARVREQAQAASSARAAQLRSRLGVGTDELPSLLLDMDTASGQLPLPPAHEAVALPVLVDKLVKPEPSGYEPVHDHEVEVAQPAASDHAASGPVQSAKLGVPALSSIIIDEKAAGIEAPSAAPPSSAARVTLPPRQKPKKPKPQVRIAPSSAQSSAPSSIMPPMIAAEPTPRSHKSRDTRLLVAAAVVGIGFFALVARERGAAPARARHEASSVHAGASSAQSAVTPVVKSPDLGAALVQAPSAPASAPTATALAPAADAGAETRALAAAKTTPEALPKRARRAMPVKAPAAPAAPSVEDLIDTRR